MLILACFLNKQRKTPPPPPSKPSPSTQVWELCQKQPNAKHSQRWGRESKLWEGTGLTSERATCKKFLPNYWECTGSLYNSVLVHIHFLKGGSLFYRPCYLSVYNSTSFFFFLLKFQFLPLLSLQQPYFSSSSPFLPSFLFHSTTYRNYVFFFAVYHLK